MSISNHNKALLDSEERLISGFLRNLLSHPHNKALFVNDRYYTYLELWNCVLKIHQKLPSEKKVENIGIYCCDDIITYSSILAINLYGAAYVPLNNKFPISRNKKIIEQCQLKLILTSVQNDDFLELDTDIDILLLEDIEISNKEQGCIETNQIQENNYFKVNQPNAYILFTSGSTGEPKGVPVSHNNVNQCFDFFLKNYDFNDRDKFIQTFELTFDLSVFSFFMPLMIGACCYVVPSDGIKFLKTMEYLKKYQITVAAMVPSILKYVENYLSEISLPDIRYSFFMGDALFHHLAVKWNKSTPNAVLHNFYGPTEATIDCTRYIFESKKSAEESINGIVPLGKAFDGLDILIINENNLVTEKGELCLSGRQVITRYLNFLNEDKFFVYQNKRYYKTGDIVSINASGNLIFYGRADTQVKINGYRVELSEIENAISEIINAKCIALCINPINGTNRIVLFIEKKQIDETNLKEILADILPHYMIPHQFITLEKFDLNINGKVDKQKLLKYC